MDSTNNAIAYVTNIALSPYDRAKEVEALKEEKLAFDCTSGESLIFKPHFNSSEEILEIEVDDSQFSQSFFLSREEVTEIVKWLHKVYGLGVVQLTDGGWTRDVHPTLGFRTYGPSINTAGSVDKMAVPYGC